jgi:endonuclease/exonuclease/phosphatase (EEP) superfamily protein YafD
MKKRFARLGRGLLVGAALVYAVALLVAALLWTYSPELHWTVTLSNVVAPLFFAPLLLLLPLAALVRSRWMLGAAGLGIGLFALLFGELFLPRAHPAVDGGEPLRVVTINQFYAAESPAQQAARLASYDADLIAIQELSPALAELFAGDLRADYPYQELEPIDGPGGLGVISRYPFALMNPDHGLSAPVRVEVNGRPVVVWNVHLHFSGISRVRSERFFGLPYLRMYDREGRVYQVRELLEQLEPVDEPVIVLGDFNTGDREAGYELMATEFRDVFRETSSGFGYTFPNKRRFGPVTVPVPLVRIDYIWARGPLTAMGSHVDCGNGSDHCSVIADLRIEGR